MARVKCHRISNSVQWHAMPHHSLAVRSESPKHPFSSQTAFGSNDCAYPQSQCIVKNPHRTQASTFYTQLYQSPYLQADWTGSPSSVPPILELFLSRCCRPCKRQANTSNRDLNQESSMLGTSTMTALDSDPEDLPVGTCRRPGRLATAATATSPHDQQVAIVHSVVMRGRWPA